MDEVILYFVNYGSKEKQIKVDKKAAQMFFNRKKELNFLKEILVDNAEKPKIHLLMGFYKCGKTTLVKHFLKNHFPEKVVYFHLRGENVTTMDGFLRSLKNAILECYGDPLLTEEQFEFVEEQIKRGYGGNVCGEVSAGLSTPIKMLVNVEGKIKTEYQNNWVIVRIFRKMAKPDYDVKTQLLGDFIEIVKKEGRVGRPVTLVIDEFNTLKSVIRTEDDLNELKVFIEALETLAHNYKLLNVLLCSTESSVKYFLEKLSLSIHTYYKPFFIGGYTLLKYRVLG